MKRRVNQTKEFTLAHTEHFRVFCEMVVCAGTVFETHLTVLAFACGVWFLIDILKVYELKVGGGLS